MFTKYFAANFAFGHSFRVKVGNANDLDEARERGEEFLGNGPVLVKRPTLAGL